MTGRVEILACKIPIASRYLSVAIWFVAAAAHAQTLSERDVVGRALERPALVEAMAASVDGERGRGAAAGAVPNPQLIYMREQTYNSKGTGEDYLSISQTIHLGGRYRLNRQAFEARIAAREQEGRAIQLAVAADARSRFYECLFREQRVRALEAWVAQVDRALAVVASREARGDAAQYDQRRLERERVVAAGRLEAERAQQAAATHRLNALLGLQSEHLTLSGTLLPEHGPRDFRELHSASAQRPDLLALEHEKRAATLTARAAGRTWVPELRLEGGYKGIELNAGGRTDGFLAGGSLSLPLWDRGSGAKRAASAQARDIDAHKRLAQEELAGELLGARAQAEQMRTAAVRFRSDSARISADLTRIATAGYEGGELGLFELLDACRGAAEDELTALDMELSARRAFIELDRLTGAGLP